MSPNSVTQDAAEANLIKPLFSEDCSYLSGVMLPICKGQIAWHVRTRKKFYLSRQRLVIFAHS